MKKIGYVAAMGPEDSQTSEMEGRAKQFLKRVSKPGLGVLSLALLTSSAWGQVTFNASGTFQDGSTLSGTVIIDTSSGNGVEGGSLTIDNIGGVSGDDVTLAGDINNQNPLGGSNTWFAYDFDNGDSAGDYYLDLYFPAGATTLNGYTGGQLCSTTTSCYEGVDVFFGKDFIGSASYVDLSSGSLSSASSAPEPSSIALILGGAAALAAVRRRKHRA